MFGLSYKDQDFRATLVMLQIVGAFAVLRLMFAWPIAALLGTQVEIVEAVFQGIMHIALLIFSATMFQRKWVKFGMISFSVLVTLSWVHQDIIALF
jgi:hypothetical protein